MTRTVQAVVTLFLLLAGATAVLASRSDEQREAARAARDEAALRAEEGRRVEDERSRRVDRELDERAKAREAGSRREGLPPESEREIVQLKDRLAMLYELESSLRRSNPSAPERRKAQLRIVEVERELHVLMKARERGPRPEREPEAQPPPIEEAVRRARHLRVAVENLQAAGVHDLAEKLAEQAERMERDAREAKERLAQASDRHEEGGPREAEIRALRRRNAELEEEVGRLRAELDRR